MNPLRRIVPFACILLAVFALPARALFDVKDPLSKMYNVQSRSVFSGVITDINPENHVLTVNPTTLYKGPSPAGPGESVKVQLQAPESLRADAKVNAPIVIFKGAISVVIHVADHWYSAESLAKPNLFRINGLLGQAAHTTHDETFPGTTADLIKALDELKAGKSTLLDAFPELKLPAPQKAGMLPAGAIAFAAADLPDYKSPVFFVATKDKFQALTFGEGQSPQDITSKLGLEKLRPALLAVVPGAPLLLAGHDFYLPDAQKKFTRAIGYKSLPDEKILAAAFTDNALFLLTPPALKRTRIDVLALHEGEPPSQPSAHAPLSEDNDTRLTGTLLTDYYPAHAKGFTSASLAAVDINGDHRPDLILATPEGTLTLLNRGFGGYIVSKDFAAGLLDPGKTGKSALPLLASTPNKESTLWLLVADGTLYRCDFPTK